MAERLTKSDLERIEKFAETPMHERSPEMLLPEGARDGKDHGRSAEG